MVGRDARGPRTVRERASFDTGGGGVRDGPLAGSRAGAGPRCSGSPAAPSRPRGVLFVDLEEGTCGSARRQPPPPRGLIMAGTTSRVNGSRPEPSRGARAPPARPLADAARITGPQRRAQRPLRSAPRPGGRWRGRRPGPAAPNACACPRPRSPGGVRNRFSSGRRTLLGLEAESTGRTRPRRERVDRHCVAMSALPT